VRLFLIAGLILIPLALLLVSQSHALTAKPSRGGAARTLTYQGITVTAPNQPDRAFYVFAKKNGKTLWETGKQAATPEPPNSPIKNEVVELTVKNVQERDLDKGADNYSQLKAYIGKPALYIKETSSSSPLPSWLIVDISTGAQIGFIAFN
jgi:outer membrane protein assembly factor BamB